MMFTILVGVSAFTVGAVAMLNFVNIGLKLGWVHFDDVTFDDGRGNRV